MNTPLSRPGTGNLLIPSWLRMFGLVSWVIGLLAMATLTASAADQAGQARRFVEDLGAKVMTILQQGTAGSAARQEQFQTLFVESFDAPLIGRFTLGRHWDGLTEDQRASYLQSFNGYVAAIYAAQFSTYAGEVFEITDSEARPDSRTMVGGVIKKAAAQPTKIQFHVLTRDNSAKIVDIAVSGISLIVTKRSEFNSVIQREGFDGLKQRMDETVRRIRSASS